MQDEYGMSVRRSARDFTPHMPAELTVNTREMAAALIACGLDTNKAIPLIRPVVPSARTRVAMVADRDRMGWLNRMTQFKDVQVRTVKAQGAVHISRPSGCRRPLVSGDDVPVGEDQNSI
jgi:tryptophanyl-tRNA synthetase